MSLSVATESKSARKYPNVMWFPRSKTDPKEIREVLKLALKVQTESKDNFFNDKLLGEYMAKIGSINVVGLQGEKYIEAYQGKSIGDTSYITNARMLMRVFRFLGLVTRIKKGSYQITDLGKKYSRFSGDFPSKVDGEDEEQMLLDCLGSFSFYSVNDDSNYRDSSFQIRPFVWLLNNLLLEPQCIFQLITTAFASKSETITELERINEILKNLREGKTNLKKEFKKLGLDADDYSCVHNFYDSAKILIYLGVSLGLVEKKNNPQYGSKISGKARYLKQAHAFYTLSEKGKKYLKEKIQAKLLYYSDIYAVAGDECVLECSFILSTLNFKLGSQKIKSINKKYFENIIGDKLDKSLEIISDNLQLEIENSDGDLSLKSSLVFNFFQNVPPEFLHDKPFSDWYRDFIEKFAKKDKIFVVEKAASFEQFAGKVVSEFILKKGVSYKIPNMDLEKSEIYIKYSEKDDAFGGQDRYASRISPTNSVILVGNRVHVDNDRDALDLLIPLRSPDNNLKHFVKNNLLDLVKNFINRSNDWAKDQHYAWVRNCFRLFGAEAIYSGSSGMLSRADVSVISPLIGGIEAKSPSENRGSISTGAIRQAFDAKIQVADKYPEKKNLPRVAIAIGRRITPRAIEEEAKYRSEGLPILLITDAILYYLTLKTTEIPFDGADVLTLFAETQGHLTGEILLDKLTKIASKHNLKKEVIENIEKELKEMKPIINNVTEGAIED